MGPSLCIETNGPSSRSLSMLRSRCDPVCSARLFRGSRIHQDIELCMKSTNETPFRSYQILFPDQPQMIRAWPSFLFRRLPDKHTKSHYCASMIPQYRSDNVEQRCRYWKRCIDGVGCMASGGRYNTHHTSGLLRPRRLGHRHGHTND